MTIDELRVDTNMSNQEVVPSFAYTKKWILFVLVLKKDNDHIIG